MSNFKFCAKYGEECDLSRSRKNVYFGPTNPYTSNDISGTFRDFNTQLISPETPLEKIMCNNSSFNIKGPEPNNYNCYIRDAPSVGFEKAVYPNGMTGPYMPSMPVDYTFCAKNNGVCSSRNYPSNVIYGADDNYTSAYAPAGLDIPCNSNKFGLQKDYARANISSCYFRRI